VERKGTVRRMQRGLSRGGPSSESFKGATVEVEEGYRTSAVSGLNAYRIPCANFAGFLFSPEGTRFSVLQLVVEAVSATGYYAVFGSKPITCVLQFKWNGYAYRKFQLSILENIIHLVIASIFITEVELSVDKTAKEILGGHGGNPDFIVIFGWLWTTFYALKMGNNELAQLYSVGIVGYFSDASNIADLFYLTTQLLSNTIFLFPHSWETLFRTGDFANSQTVYVENSTEVGGAARRLKGVSTSTFDAADENDYDTEPIGFFISLLAFVALALYLRMLILFRGFLKFGALINMVIQILIDMLPLGMLLLIVIVAFSFSLSVMLRHSAIGVIIGYSDQPVEWDFAYSLFFTMNMGLYASFDPGVMDQYPQVNFLYQTFMVLTQIVLLNLLIAIMGASHQRVMGISELVALHERAKLILEHEQTLGRVKVVPERQGWRRILDSSARRRARDYEKLTAEWLHILEPAERTDLATDQHLASAVAENKSGYQRHAQTATSLQYTQSRKKQHQHVQEVATNDHQANATSSADAVAQLLKMLHAVVLPAQEQMANTLRGLRTEQSAFLQEVKADLSRMHKANQRENDSDSFVTTATKRTNLPGSSAPSGAVSVLSAASPRVATQPALGPLAAFWAGMHGPSTSAQGPSTPQEGAAHSEPQRNGPSHAPAAPMPLSAPQPAPVRDVLDC